MKNIIVIGKKKKNLDINTYLFVYSNIDTTMYIGDKTYKNKIIFLSFLITVLFLQQHSH